MEPVEDTTGVSTLNQGALRKTTGSGPAPITRPVVVRLGGWTPLRGLRLPPPRSYKGSPGGRGLVPG